MTAIGSASSAAAYQAPPAAPAAASQKGASSKVDRDGDHDNSPPSEAGTPAARPLNVVA